MTAGDPEVGAGAALLCALISLDLRDERGLELFVLRNGQGWTWQRCGERYGISRERARQIVVRIEARLQRDLARHAAELLEAAA